MARAFIAFDSRFLTLYKKSCLKKKKKTVSIIFYEISCMSFNFISVAEFRADAQYLREKKKNELIKRLNLI